ncbi:hypothetical protein U1Q18_026318 [Sarracenia purpurea var. burkii]
MGKSLPSPTILQDFAARIIASDKLHSPKQIRPLSKNRVVKSPEPPKPRRGRVQSEQLRVNMEGSSEEVRRRRLQGEEQGRVPLAEVVSDCVRRWFQDTLKEAKSGDSAMQVLVSQMYFSGYGVPRDAQKGRAWITRASMSRSSVCKVSDKHPGYNASDSDSDDTKADAK